MSYKSALLVILNTVVAVITAWWLLNAMKGSLGSNDGPYLLISAGLTAFAATVILMRPILRRSLDANKSFAWFIVCLLNVGVVLITHIGVGATLGSRSFSRYHEQMRNLHPDTYLFEASNWMQSVLIWIAGSVYLFWPVTITAGIVVAIVWLLRFAVWPATS